jgi:glycosyltransferase involved in cell wall biosynthesis
VNVTPLTPNVTIAIITYNRCDYLRQSIEAALAQTYHDFELLVVDNASTDDTARMVSQYKDPRLIYIRRSVNGGPAVNCIEAMSRAKGNFLLISHDDDLVHPELVERQLRAFEDHPDTALVATNVSLIDYKGEILQEALYDITTDRFFEKGEFLKVSLDEGFWLPAPTFMLRRKFKGKRRNLWMSYAHGDKDAANFFGITGDMWSACRMNGLGSIVFLAKPLLAYRQHQEQHNFNDDQIAPQVPFFRSVLKCLCRRRDVFRPYTQKVEAYLLRYQAQELLLKQLKRFESGAPVLQRLQSFEHKLLGDDSITDNSDYYTQFTLLVQLLGGKSNLISSVQEEWLDEPVRDHLSAFRRWLAHFVLRSQLLSSTLSMRNVRKAVILGSLLNAATIALDCKLGGIDILGFLDSNRWRAGHTLGGLPIMGIERVPELLQKADILIFSSERKKESALKQYLQQYLSSPDIDRCVSWMTLAGEITEKGKRSMKNV